MGCWNATCGISDLPIFYGEEVVLYIIEKSSKANGNGLGFCYSDDIYEPISPPIYGNYNDYGGIENINKSESFIFEYLKSIKYKVNEKKAKRDYLVDKQPKNLEELINDYIAREIYDGVGFILIRRDIYDILLKNMKDEINFSKLLSDTDSFFNTFNPEDYLGWLTLKRENIFLRSINRFNKLETLIQETVNKNKTHLKEDFIEVILTDLVLRDLRKYWHVSSGAGSQAGITKSHRLLSEAMTRIIDIFQEEKDEDGF